MFASEVFPGLICEKWMDWNVSGSNLLYSFHNIALRFDVLANGFFAQTDDSQYFSIHTYFILHTFFFQKILLKLFLKLYFPHTVQVQTHPKPRTHNHDRKDLVPNVSARVLCLAVDLKTCLSLILLKLNCCNSTRIPYPNLFSVSDYFTKQYYNLVLVGVCVCPYGASVWFLACATGLFRTETNNSWTYRY